MTGNTYAVGDSLAVGLGGVSGVRSFATGGMGVPDMGTHFAEALSVAQPDDLFIISAGYNSSIPETQLRGWVQGLRDKGAQVAILGLREEWPNGGTYAHIAPHMPARNETLERIATATGSVLVSEATTLGNALPNGEVHYGNYAPLLTAVSTAASRAPAQPAPAASTPAPARDTATADSNTEQTARQREQAADQSTAPEAGKEGGIVGFFMKIITWVMNALGLNRENAAPAAETPATASGSASEPAASDAAQPEVTPPGTTPAVTTPAPSQPSAAR